MNLEKNFLQELDVNSLDIAEFENFDFANLDVTELEHRLEFDCCWVGVGEDDRIGIGFRCSW